MKQIRFLVILVLLQSPLFAATFESAARNTALLELYSSEGCSSCPPADDWVRQFREQSTLWKDFVPVIFHVDYWDGAGWKDPFGSPDFTARQEKYIRIWRGQTLYTPCVALNGRPLGAGWNRVRTLPVFNESPGVLKVENAGPGRYRIVFLPQDKTPENYEAHLALLGFDIESRVQKGENSGKTLKHDFVVLDYQHTSMAGTSGPSAALNLNTQDSRAKKFGIAAWVTQSGNPLPLQATGGYL